MRASRSARVRPARTNLRNSGGWRDVSVAVHPDLVRWPGDPPIRIEHTLEKSPGGRCRVSAISMSVHTGTHVDAPLHFIPRGAGVDELPLGALLGPARVIAIRDPQAIRATELREHHLRRGERVLFRTRNSAEDWTRAAFRRDFVHIAADAAALLARRAVRTVGIDYLSVGAPGAEGDRTHITLLRAGICLVEGLDLARVRPGRYELLGLPLRIMNADGAPARVLLRRAPR